jgi:hypothetical protein
MCEAGCSHVQQMSLDIQNVYQIMAIRLGFNDSVRENLSTEAENFPLLEAVTRERLVKTQQAGKDLTCAVVIYKVWRLAMAL